MQTQEQAHQDVESLLLRMNASILHSGPAQAHQVLT